MQIFIHFINKIFKTTDKSKGADTEVLRTRLFFQHHCRKSRKYLFAWSKCSKKYFTEIFLNYLNWFFISFLKNDALACFTPHPKIKVMP